MATIGLSDLHIAKITSAADATPVVYAVPKRIAKAIKADITVETAEATLYADDSIDDSASEFVGGKIKLGVNDLSSDALIDLLGWEKDTAGVVYADKDAVAPYVAVGFKSRKSNGEFKFVWLYKVKFSVPSENYETKGSGISFKTPEIEGRFMARSDGRWKADYAGSGGTAPGNTWFTKVVEKAGD